jgi:hypothetical protein
MWSAILRLLVGLQVGRSYERKGWILKVHYHGERIEFEVGNYETEPPFVHAFHDSFEAAWFFMNICDGEVAEIVPPTED